MRIEFECQACSDVGCVRSHNEDMILLNGKLLRNQELNGYYTIDNNGRFVVAVADGMGGHAGGEVASEMALQFLDVFMASLPENISQEDFTNAFHRWIGKSHSLINQKGVNISMYKGMGTTLVGMLVIESRVYAFNVGDSRLYRYRDGILKQLSIDHSMREKYHNLSIPSNVIYNSLGGGGNSAFADLQDLTEMIFADDRFLICSDGLCDMLSDDELCALCEENSSATQFVGRAKEAGGTDNISVVVVDIKHIGYKAESEKL